MTDEPTTDRLGVGRMPRWAGWYLYRQTGAQVTALARFLSDVAVQSYEEAIEVIGHPEGMRAPTGPRCILDDGRTRITTDGSFRYLITPTGGRGQVEITVHRSGDMTVRVETPC